MKNYSLSQLQRTDFDIRNITVLAIHYHPGSVTDYSKTARSKNLLHLITEGTREYQFRDQRFLLGKDSVFLIPDKTYYMTKVLSHNGSFCDGIGICFDLFLPNGEKILLEPGIYYQWNNTHKQYINIFHLMNDCFEKPDFSILKLKSLLYRLLSNLLSNTTDISAAHTLIEPAIDYITSHYEENCPIKTYADQCGLSESYFRKKFVECTGMSPIEYRNKIRLMEARKLYHENYSIQEISEKVGFCDASYFSKIYKREIGSSLKNDLEIV